MENLEYTARIRARATNELGDDLPDDSHHGHKVQFDASYEHFYLIALDDRNQEKRIPLTIRDLEKISAAVTAFERMKGIAA